MGRVAQATTQGKDKKPQGGKGNANVEDVVAETVNPETGEVINNSNNDSNK